MDAGFSKFSSAPPVLLAALKGRDTAVSLLVILLGAGPSLPDDEGTTALPAAAYNGHKFTVRLLVAILKIDPNLAGSSGGTALSLACLGGHLELVHLLLASLSANPKLRTVDGRSGAKASSRKPWTKVCSEERGWWLKQPKSNVKPALHGCLRRT